MACDWRVRSQIGSMENRRADIDSANCTRIGTKIMRMVKSGLRNVALSPCTPTPQKSKSRVIGNEREPYYWHVKR